MSDGKITLAYQTIKNKNLLSKRRFQVYEIMVENAPLALTPNELLEELKQRDGKVRHNIHARLDELKQLGVIEESSYRLCSQSNIKSVTHSVTGELPTGKAKKAVVTREELERRIAELEEENDQLRTWLMQPVNAARRESNR